MLIRDSKFFFTVLVGVIAFCFMFGSNLINFLESNQIISFTQDKKISVVPFTNVIWYIRGILGVSFIACFYLGYKSIFEEDKYGVWTMFCAWIGFVLFFAHKLAQPVPWYGFIFCLSFLYFLFWIFFRAVFPANFKKT